MSAPRKVVDILEERWTRDHENQGGGCESTADGNTIFFLQDYEREHGVTLLAVKTTALEEVGRTLAQWDRALRYEDVRDEELADAVDDLLGLR